MLPRLRAIAVAGMSGVMLATGLHASHAASNPAVNKEVLHLANEWASIKYLSKDDSERQAKMAVLGQQADEDVKKFPGRVEILIWDGIITSEQASLTWGLTALNLATRARDTLLEAEKLDPKALDAGAPTSLGVLYYRVPGFPVGWGDNKKAREYLEFAVHNAPNGRDAHYFYGDFLYERGEYKKAEEVLKKALTLPSHPERPVWDKYFPMVIKNLLERVQAKIAS